MWAGGIEQEHLSEKPKQVPRTPNLIRTHMTAAPGMQGCVMCKGRETERERNKGVMRSRERPWCGMDATARPGQTRSGREEEKSSIMEERIH